MSKDATNTAVLDRPKTAEPAAKEELPPDAKRVVQPLNHTHATFALREQVAQVYMVTLEEGVGPKDLLVPGYWAHVGHLLRPRDKIEAWAHDMTWYAEYMVLGAQRLLAHVAMCNFVELSDKPVVPGEPISDYKAEYKGLAKLWCVTSANGIHKEELPTKQAALDAIRDMLKAG